MSGPDGAPTPGVNVLAISAATGVQRGTQTDDAGRYQIPFLDPGVYTLRAQRIGLQAVEKPAIRVALGSVQKVDFQLQSAAVTLSTQQITAEANPLIEETKTGSSTRIDAEQIVELPTSGRDYTDLIKLAPGVSDVGNAGSGGGQSIGGGRTGASNILMDGANNNEGFFGGDARGGDRAPFSFSIEAVKELQVITSAVDVEYGNFTGGAVNAVTKSGTNEFSGALFGYFRGAEFGGVKITGQDFLGRDPTAFEQRQYGLAIGGPIVKDKAHFYFTFDKQTSADPRLVFVGAGTGDAFTRSAGINADTLANFLRIAEAKGVNLRGELGSLAQNVDQPAFFGRIDWQVSNNHKLTLRNNYTYTTLRNDRLTVGLNLMDLASNAGPNEDKSNSFVGSLQSVFGAVTNEMRVQYATVRKPRPSNPTGDLGVPISQIRINNVRSALSDGSTTVTGIIFGADPVLHANVLETDLVEVIDNVRFTRGNHTFKVGGSFTRQSVYNQFWNNHLGSFTFNSLADFENDVVTTYTRALPFPGKSQIDVPEFALNEGALYAQDEWQVTPRLFLQYGLRYDWVGFPDAPEANPQLSTLFPYLDIQDLPDDNNNVSPRLGFTFDPGADGRQLFRGSTAVMYGRNPYVTVSNSFQNSGRSQTTLTCTGANAPVVDFAALGAGDIPSQCVGAGAPAAAPEANVFEKDYKQAYTWKSNLAYDRLLGDNWAFTLEGVYGVVRNNFLVQDDNLNTTPLFTIEGGMPVYVDPLKINAATGAINLVDSRRFSDFSRVLVHRAIGSTVVRQGSAVVRGRVGPSNLYFAYTNDGTSDNGSLSCCITGSMYSNSRPFGNTNDYDAQWGPLQYNRRHTFIFSPNFELPYGFRVSGILNHRSGTPWTPIYSNDVNGDGTNANDRLYVPTAGEVAGYLFAGNSAEEQSRERSLFEQKLSSVACLRENRGKVVARNSCRNPWLTTVDLRVAKRITTLRDQNVELQADFFNIGNLIDDKYGRIVDVSSTNQALLITTGFDANQRKFRYRTNPEFGRSTPNDAILTQQFRMQLGLRYNF